MGSGASNMGSFLGDGASFFTGFDWLKLRETMGRKAGVEQDPAWSDAEWAALSAKLTRAAADVRAKKLDEELTPVTSEVLWTPARGGEAEAYGLWTGMEPCPTCGAPR